MTNDSRRRGVLPFINVTPLIDVLLVLLIIFMVVAPSRPHKFESQIPEKSDPDKPVTHNELSLVVTIPVTGNGYRLNTLELATVDDLRTKLLGALDGRPADRKAVFIKAPRSLDYGQVIKIVDVVKGAGGYPIGLQLEALEDGKRPS